MRNNSRTVRSESDNLIWFDSVELRFDSKRYGSFSEGIFCHRFAYI